MASRAVVVYHEKCAQAAAHGKAHHRRQPEDRTRVLGGDQRAKSAQDHQLIPIVCVGETFQQREMGEAERVIRRQIEQGLEGIEVKRLIVAYEPIWAIGTGKTCEANEANRICGLIRKWIGYEDVIIQYGGSVKSNNIDEIMSMSDIDGVLVGGASLDPTNFARIANYEKI